MRLRLTHRAKIVRASHPVERLRFTLNRAEAELLALAVRRQGYSAVGVPLSIGFRNARPKD